MEIAKLSRLNLSLLATLQALLQEGSARAAADKLKLSQSAVSKNLAQLRVLFDDTLFYRTATGLAPTPLAKGLEQPLSELLLQINDLINPAEFVPAGYQGRIQLAMHDVGFALIGAQLLAVCEQQAPGLEMDMWFKDNKGLQALINAEIDLLILPQDIGQSWQDDKNLVWRELYREPLACLLRSGHPALDKDWDETAYFSYSHIGVRDSQLGTSMLDQVLNQRHQARRFSAMVPDFHTATRLVQQTDSIFTAVHCWAELAVSEVGLVRKPLPLPGYECAYQLVWHKRTDTSQLHIWLRGKIVEICEALSVRYQL